MKANSLVVVLTLLVSSTVGPALADDSAYIEFLWAPPVKGALARAEALGLVLDGAQDHRICVKVSAGARNGALRIDAVDAAGDVVQSQRHKNFDGAKQCYPTDLPSGGLPGDWTFNVYLDGSLLTAKTIEVASTLNEASFYAESSRPYVLGRPNYDASIPPRDYIGRLSWIMSVDTAGVVRNVEVEAAEGAGKAMKDRAIAAGYLTIFPPNQSPTATPLKVRQEYILDTD
jgi:hypothetical protein